MNSLFLKLYVTLVSLKDNEEAQDMVEYALLVSLIALALISAIGKLASALTTLFTNVSSSLA